MPLFTNYGKAKDTIANHIKDIEQVYIPALNSQLDTNINNYPKLIRETYAIYEDSEQGIQIEISSNNRDIDNKGDLFVSVSYDNMKEDAGIINLNDVQDAVNITQYSLQELGFKTAEDKENDRKREEEEKRKAEEDKQKEIERNQKRKEELRREAEKDSENDDETSTEEPEEDNYDENKPEYETELRNKIDYVSKGAEGQTVSIDWPIIPNNQDSSKMNVVHVEVILTHISGNNFLLETRKINPKVQKVLNIEDSISYINKVSDKLREIPSIEMKDEKGKEMNLPANYNADSDDSFSIDI